MLFSNYIIYHRYVCVAYTVCFRCSHYYFAVFTTNDYIISVTIIYIYVLSLVSFVSLSIIVPGLFIIWICLSYLFIGYHGLLIIQTQFLGFPPNKVSTCFNFFLPSSCYPSWWFKLWVTILTSMAGQPTPPLRNPFQKYCFNKALLSETNPTGSSLHLP